METAVDVARVIHDNYLPYAAGTILARAIPAIDGLKPVNRRILYAMHLMNLKNGLSKSSNIVGQTMQFHPHGDSAIYDAMVRMTSGHEALNAPYIRSKGSFGKSWARDMQSAAPRYTEAGLAEIVEYIMDGIDEDAVDMVPNFDEKKMEPILLPVKFPTILVNPSSGIAVGASSYIPPFGLKAVCDTTIKVLKGEIANSDELMESLGAPDFPTGGYIHGGKADYIRLAQTGKGSFHVSGAVEMYNNRIIIREIPYGTTVEAIVEAIIAGVKSGELKGITDVRDETGLSGLRVVIEFRSNQNPSALLRKINWLTRLRMKMAFSVKVIVQEDGKLQCLDLGVEELLNRWITFRLETLSRIYRFRLKKRTDQEHVLASWEKIQDKIREVANFITNHTEEEVGEYLTEEFGMSDIQKRTLMDAMIKEFTKDRVSKRLRDLFKVREEIADFTDILGSEQRKKSIIISELKEISEKFGKERRTSMAAPVEELISEKEEEVPPDTTLVSIIVTGRNYIKRVVSLNDERYLKIPDDEKIKYRFNCRNNEEILVFTYGGYCHKFSVDSIDASRGGLKDLLTNMIDRVDTSEILAVMPAGDYTGSINIVYSTGRGRKVYFSDVAGNRSKYKSVYESGTPRTMWATTENKFFMITRKKRASYTDLSMMGMLSSRAAFKVARVANDDEVFGLQPLNRVPNPDAIDLEHYSKQWCVKIKDTLWE